MTDKAFFKPSNAFYKAKTSTSYKFALLLVIAKLCRDEADSDGFLSYEQLTDCFMPHTISPLSTRASRQTNGRGGSYFRLPSTNTKGVF